MPAGRRRGGVAVELPPPGATDDIARARAAAQLPLALDTEAAWTGAVEVLPDAVHVRGWLDDGEQRALAAQFHEWARGPAGLRHPRVNSGHLMSIQSVCLGWHWQPSGYSRTADDTDGTPVKPLPADLADLARRAVADASVTAPTVGAADRFRPDSAIVNRYPPGAKLGIHCDDEEPSDASVVTISLGDTATFRFASVERRTGPFTDVELRSGDLLVFGGANRRVHHGVPKVHAGTGPAGLGLPPGRVSITVRETGFPAG